MESLFARDRNHRLCPVLERECRLVRNSHWHHCSDLRLALDFRHWLGGEHKINEYTHNLAVAGGKHLASLLGTSVMDPEGDLTLNMVRKSSILFLCHILCLMIRSTLNCPFLATLNIRMKLIPCCKTHCCLSGMHMALTTTTMENGGQGVVRRSGMRWEYLVRQEMQILRIKVQISDFEVLAEAFKDACRKVVKFARQSSTLWKNIDEVQMPQVLGQ